MNDLDLKAIGKMILQAIVWGLASFLMAWQGDTTIKAALQIAGGVTGAWMMGHLQRTGEVKPRIEGLQK